MENWVQRWHAILYISLHNTIQHVCHVAKLYDLYANVPRPYVWPKTIRMNLTQSPTRFLRALDLSVSSTCQSPWGSQDTKNKSIPACKIVSLEKPHFDVLFRRFPLKIQSENGARLMKTKISFLGFYLLLFRTYFIIKNRYRFLCVGPFTLLFYNKAWHT